MTKRLKYLTMQWILIVIAGLVTATLGNCPRAWAAELEFPNFDPSIPQLDSASCQDLVPKEIAGAKIMPCHNNVVLFRGDLPGTLMASCPECVEDRRLWKQVGADILLPLKTHKTALRLLEQDRDGVVSLEKVTREAGMDCSEPCMWCDL